MIHKFICFVLWTPVTRRCLEPVRLDYEVVSILNSPFRMACVLGLVRDVRGSIGNQTIIRALEYLPVLNWVPS